MQHLNQGLVHTAREARIGQMRHSALLATIKHDRADLLSQLLNHLGNRHFARTLADLSAAEQVRALRLLNAKKRASLYRELSQPQRDLWHAVLKREARRSLIRRLTSWLRPARLKATRP
ncbi:hypothetical protein [Diaphorobacter aerolatus]|uniref:Uncharacterized protein n=1 Tax=Diaphorobacter aerolatus TaxID=1288495 RepID=A0A7H0GP14_9BURK|nr:hypothetical protein [Diaphorobacter aerolatus]QNP50030.1 hypothetical protein H9K75_09375 [Diaphorobacter aerolatus]